MDCSPGLIQCVHNYNAAHILWFLLVVGGVSEAMVPDRVLADPLIRPYPTYPQCIGVTYTCILAFPPGMLSLGFTSRHPMETHNPTLWSSIMSPHGPALCRPNGPNFICTNRSSRNKKNKENRRRGRNKRQGAVIYHTSDLLTLSIAS